MLVFAVATYIKNILNNVELLSVPLIKQVWKWPNLSRMGN